jgi:hypothetical protein
VIKYFCDNKECGKEVADNNNKIRIEYTKDGILPRIYTMMAPASMQPDTSKAVQMTLCDECYTVLINYIISHEILKNHIEPQGGN